MHTDRKKRICRNLAASPIHIPARLALLTHHAGATSAREGDALQLIDADSLGNGVQDGPRVHKPGRELGRGCSADLAPSERRKLPIDLTVFLPPRKNIHKIFYTLKRQN